MKQQIFYVSNTTIVSLPLKQPVLKKEANHSLVREAVQIEKEKKLAYCGCYVLVREL